MMTKNIFGFSLIELLVVVAIIGVLAAVGVVGYTVLIGKTQLTVLKQNRDLIEKKIKFELDAFAHGINSGVKNIDTNNPLQTTDTCDQMLRSLQDHFSGMSNPYDTSRPTITLYTGSRKYHEMGKIRLTCYKAHGGSFTNGSNCPISDAAIRVDTYYVDCGGDCEKSTCTVPNKNCLGTDASSPFGEQERNKILGDLWPKSGGATDYAGAAADCGVSSVTPGTTYPKEADY